ncbi:aldehyde dehydrogenase family protein [Litoribacter ruber]|nr:acyl-CoA reductase [Litoribacter alkaliphilus]
MMTLQERIQAFVNLGKTLENLSEEEFETLSRRVENNNNWFTQEQTRSALEGLQVFLQEKALADWLGKYDLVSIESPRKIGVLMAGNVPAVGFHDFMTVLLSGHEFHGKLSSNDEVLMKWLAEELVAAEPRFADYIYFESMLKGMDAYIATGSDNSARYFEYYFGKYPNIIRKNRSSVAVFTGEEGEKDYLALGHDIFQYYGLGCRNISKVFLPNEEQLQDFLKAIQPFESVINHHKYRNNYDYNKSIYLVNQQPHLDNGFLLLTKGEGLVSPISVLYYEIYEDQQELESKLSSYTDKIQCVVSKEGQLKNSLPFGDAQCPGLEDYADNVDTMAFLIDLK